MDIKKTNGYSITNNATEYLFESYEDAKFFKWGYKSGLSGLESKIKKKAYLLGYQEGANRARGRLNEAR